MGEGKTISTTDVLGVPMFVGRLTDACDWVVARAAARTGGYVCLCNVHVLTESARNPLLRHALLSAQIVLPDGAPIAWLQRRQRSAMAERTGGPDLMAIVCDRGRQRGIRHFLYGSTDLVLSRLSARLKAQYPEIRIVGSHSPPFPPEVEKGLPFDPHDVDVVWCALGAPRQELWMHEHASVLDGVLAVGVGAAFDFHSGSKRRAPERLRKLGLEWAFRFASEPRRLGPRYLVSNARFFKDVVSGSIRPRRLAR